jgi:hypothetical protein
MALIEVRCLIDLQRRAAVSIIPAPAKVGLLAEKVLVLQRESRRFTRCSLVEAAEAEVFYFKKFVQAVVGALATES